MAINSEIPCSEKRYHYRQLIALPLRQVSETLIQEHENIKYINT